MKQTVFTLTSLASLLMCMATVVLWVLSYPPSGRRGWTWPRREVAGTIRWTTFTQNRGDASLAFNTMTRRFDPLAPTAHWSIGWYGLSVAEHRDRGTGFLQWQVYHRNMVCLCAALPLWWLVTTFQRYRRNAGRNGHHICRRCGYDLRATPGRCPECGTPVPKTAEVSP